MPVSRGWGAVGKDKEHVFEVHEYDGNFPDMEIDAIQMVRNMVYTEVDLEENKELECALGECLMKRGDVVLNTTLGAKRKLLRLVAPFPPSPSPFF